MVPNDLRLRCMCSACEFHKQKDEPTCHDGERIVANQVNVLDDAAACIVITPECLAPILEEQYYVLHFVFVNVICPGTLKLGSHLFIGEIVPDVSDSVTLLLLKTSFSSVNTFVCS